MNRPIVVASPRNRSLIDTEKAFTEGNLAQQMNISAGLVNTWSLHNKRKSFSDISLIQFIHHRLSRGLDADKQQLIALANILKYRTVSRPIRWPQSQRSHSICSLYCEWGDNSGHLMQGNDSKSPMANQGAGAENLCPPYVLPTV